MAGPVPSKVVFLSDIPNLELGTKVRFLGCVERYDIGTATLYLQHNYPPAKESIIAHVNLDHVLEGLNHTAIQVGAYVNIVGYVKEDPNVGNSQKHSIDGAASTERKQAHVQAIMMWEAVAIKLDTYERALQGRISLGTTG